MSSVHQAIRRRDRDPPTCLVRRHPRRHICTGKRNAFVHPLPPPLFLTVSHLPKLQQQNTRFHPRRWQQRRHGYHYSFSSLAHVKEHYALRLLIHAEGTRSMHTTLHEMICPCCSAYTNAPLNTVVESIFPTSLRFLLHLLRLPHHPRCAPCCVAFPSSTHRTPESSWLHNPTSTIGPLSSPAPSHSLPGSVHPSVPPSRPTQNK